jgi:hypothetical protein
MIDPLGGRRNPQLRDRTHLSIISIPSRFAHIMPNRAHLYLCRAEQCEQAAQKVRDSGVRSVYLDIAARWRRMAKQQEEIDRILSAPRRSTE